MEEENLDEVRPVLHIFVIGFHHQLGAQVNYCFLNIFNRICL